MDGRPDPTAREKERLVKASRLYAMCQKAGVSDPTLSVALALAAFEEVPLPEASAFVRTNLTNIEDMAWAFQNSESPEDFETKLRQRISTTKPTAGRSDRRS